MNKSSDFLLDESNKLAFLQSLPEMLASSRRTFNKITQTTWSIASFENLYDGISEISSNSDLLDLNEIHQRAYAIQQYLAGFLNTNKTPTNQQIDEITYFFDQLEKSLADTQDAYKSEENNHKHLLYLLHRNNHVIKDVSSLLAEFNFEINDFDETEELVSALDNAYPAAIISETAHIPALTPLKKAQEHHQSLTGTHIPLIFISNQDDINERIAAMRAGATRYFSPPHDSNQISAEVINLATPNDQPQDKVLIIEDDPTQAEFAASILSKADMQIETVTHPLNVMQTMKDFKPDIILMDIYMPDANGMELTTVIRDDLRFIATPIIFLSGETDPEKQLDALVLGGDDFVSKPIRPKHLIATVKNRLKRTRELIHATRMQHTDDTPDSVADLTSDTTHRHIDLDLVSENNHEKPSATLESAPLTEDEILSEKIKHELNKGSLDIHYQPLLSVHNNMKDNYSLLISMQDNASQIDWQAMSEIATRFEIQKHLDHWAVKQALNAIRTLELDAKHGSIFLPLSVYDILQDNEPDWIRTLLRTRKMIGNNLVLEYHLNSLTANLKGCKAYFKELQNMGIKICLAGFPAKKAAFKLLRFLKADYIKVSNKLLETDDELINTFVNQAHKLKAQVIVSHISDPRYVNLHWTSKADLIQGDFISSPSETMNFNFSQAAL